MRTPAIGQVVTYTLTAQDATEINRRRADFHKHVRSGGLKGALTGYIGHVGNHVAEGNTYPAVIVRLFDPNSTCANLQVLLDGNDTFWATSRAEGEGPFHWSWPADSNTSHRPQTAPQPAIGRIVHYVSFGTPGGEYGKECRAAIITELTGDPNHPNQVGLCVLNPTGQFFNRAVDYHDGGEQPGDPDCPNLLAHGSPFRYCACGWAEASLVGGTWHWPERTAG